MPEPLDYGRQRRRRPLWAIGLVALAVLLLVGGYFAYQRAELALRRHRGRQAVQAWHDALPGTPIPAGTLLYSENPADFPGMIAAGGNAVRSRFVAPGAVDRDYMLTGTRFPQLDRPRFGHDGVPVLQSGMGEPVETLYVGDLAGPDGPTRLTIAYVGIPPGKGPGFTMMVLDPAYTPYPARSFERHGGTTFLPPQARPLTNLRLYAAGPVVGAPGAVALPFVSDGGTGRFLFVLEAGAIKPTLTIHWDGPPQ